MRTFIYSLLLALTLTSCRKKDETTPEDIPSLSLNPTELRLLGNWKLTHMICNSTIWPDSTIEEVYYTDSLNCRIRFTGNVSNRIAEYGLTCSISQQTWNCDETAGMYGKIKLGNGENYMVPLITDHKLVLQRLLFDQNLAYTYTLRK